MSAAASGPQRPSPPPVVERLSAAEMAAPRQKQQAIAKGVSGSSDTGSNSQQLDHGKANRIVPVLSSTLSRASNDRLTPPNQSQGGGGTRPFSNNTANNSRAAIEAASNNISCYQNLAAPAGKGGHAAPGGNRPFTTGKSGAAEEDEAGSNTSGGSACQNVSGHTAVRPEPPAEGPSGSLFRRSLSVGTNLPSSGAATAAAAPHNGNGRPSNVNQRPQLSSQPLPSTATTTSNRSPQAVHTPPPSAPVRDANTHAQPHAASAPRDTRPTAESCYSSSSNSNNAARVPKPKTAFYPRPAPSPNLSTSTPANSNVSSAASGGFTPPRSLSPGTGGVQSHPTSTSAGRPPVGAAAAGGGGVDGSRANSKLPPLVPQGPRSGLPRGLAVSAVGAPPPPAGKQPPLKNGYPLTSATPSPAVSPNFAGHAGAAAGSAQATAYGHGNTGRPPSNSYRQQQQQRPLSRPESAQAGRQPPLQPTFGAALRSPTSSPQRPSSATPSPSRSSPAKPPPKPSVSLKARPQSSETRVGAPQPQPTPQPKATAQQQPSPPSTSRVTVDRALMDDLAGAPNASLPLTSLASFGGHGDSSDSSDDNDVVNGGASSIGGSHSTQAPHPQARSVPASTAARPPRPGPPAHPHQQQQQPSSSTSRPPVIAKLSQQQLSEQLGVNSKGKSAADGTSPSVPSDSNVPAAFQRRQRQPSALAARSSVRPSTVGGGSTGSSTGACEREVAALKTYLGEEELNLSMSTFTQLGPTLSLSVALRVLNLRGSTVSSEGLRGLADVPTLQSICVSHMRELTSLVPLITPTSPDRRCGLQEIDAQCTPLRNAGLQGLERLPRLRKLDLSMTSVTDVSSLSASHSLRELYLAVTQVDSRGIAGLERIPTLVALNVSRTKVTSLRSLTHSRSLATLVLYSCKITDDDIRGISAMPRLTHVDLSTTKVTDLSVFRDSPSLKVIKAQWLALKNCVDLIQDRRASLSERGGNGDEDSGSLARSRDPEAGYAGLAEVPTLETVDLSFNTIRTVRSLCASTSLKHLILKRTKVDSAGIAEIHRLARTLETLEVTNLTDSMDESAEDDGCGGGGGGGGSSSTTKSGASSGGSNGLLCNVNMLAGLIKLTRLDISFTDVYDLRVLRALPLLKELIIVETLVTVDGLRGLEEIPSLELLDLSQTSVMSLQFLTAGAKSLKKILVRSNRNIRGFRLGHIEGLPSLESIDMSDTVVEDIRMMWTPEWPLRELTWRWRERREASGPVPPLACWVTSERLTGLASMAMLTRLDVTNSTVHSLEFLVGAPRLRTLILDGCRLLRDGHIAAISSESFVINELEELNLSNNPHFTDLTCLSRCRRLRALNVVNDTGLYARGLDGVWNLPTIKELEITNSGAEDALCSSQQQQHGSGAGGECGESSPASPLAVAAHTDSGTNATASADHRTGSVSSSSDKAGRGQAVAHGSGNHRSTPGRASGSGGGGEKSHERGRRNEEMSGLPDVSAVLHNSVTPVQFRVPRRRRVSFIAVDPSGPVAESPSG